MRRPRRTAVTLAALVLCAILAACGGSSKPGYCSAVSNLESSIKAIPSTNIVATGLNGLKSSLTKVQSDAQTAISAAQSDFPNETSALKSAVDTLETTVRQAASSPSAATLAQIPAQVSAVVTAVNNFQSATKSKCS
jgi:predicted PurR-regulated permease PerM